MKPPSGLPDRRAAAAAILLPLAAAASLAVEYDTFQPNGPRCPPTCFSAEATLAF